jgi:hypothetical protein
MAKKRASGATADVDRHAAGAAVSRGKAISTTSAAAP